MILFLTYGEYASGIYSSQVIDVCRELSSLSGKKVKLIAFISLRSFLRERKKIKTGYHATVVLPMFPKLKYYKMNSVLLALVAILHRPTCIICRNAIPAHLGLTLKKAGLVPKVILDGRAAEYEQFKEYNLANDDRFTAKFEALEKKVVREADYRIAVSEALVNYWKIKYQYAESQHVVIPCTLNTKHKQVNSTSLQRTKLGYSEKDILLVYSGSSAKWQSFDILFPFLDEQLLKNPYIKVILLIKENPEAVLFEKRHEGRVTLVWCKEHEVLNYLSISDYGILLRENTWTNKVASPVKFAEYLHAGLSVIISPEIGDFSEFVKNNNCGVLYNANYIALTALSETTREKNKTLVSLHFDKKSDSIQAKYKQLLKNM